jgi:hypothetical protein
MYIGVRSIEDGPIDKDKEKRIENAKCVLALLSGMYTYLWMCTYIHI